MPSGRPPPPPQVGGWGVDHLLHKPPRGPSDRFSAWQRRRGRKNVPPKTANSATVPFWAFLGQKCVKSAKSFGTTRRKETFDLFGGGYEYPPGSVQTRWGGGAYLLHTFNLGPQQAPDNKVRNRLALPDAIEKVYYCQGISASLQSLYFVHMFFINLCIFLSFCCASFQFSAFQSLCVWVNLIYCSGYMWVTRRLPSVFLFTLFFPTYCTPLS